MKSSGPEKKIANTVRVKNYFIGPYMHSIGFKNPRKMIENCENKNIAGVGKLKMG